MDGKISVIGYEEARSALRANRRYNVYHGLGKVVKAGRSLKRELFDRQVPYDDYMVCENVYVIESDSDVVNIGDILYGGLNGHQVRRKSEWGK